MWIKQNQKAIAISFGVILILLAVMAPIIAPQTSRSDVLIMTLLFSIIGALMIYVSVSRPQSRPSPTDLDAAARERLLRKPDRAARNRAGLAFGAAIMLAGILAPFVFPNVGPDERFAMMLGFAPVAIAGGILVYVFYRAIKPAQEKGVAPHNPSAKPPAPKRAPVARVEKSSALFAKIVPILIGLMVVVIVAIALFLIYIVVAAVLPLL